MPDDLETLRPCLEMFVPVVQQSAIDFVDDPDRANAIDRRRRRAVRHVLDRTTRRLADYSVQTQNELGLIGNGPDDTLGNMDEARVQGVLEQIRDAGIEVPDDLTAADLFTNEFIDPNIGL